MATALLRGREGGFLSGVARKGVDCPLNSSSHPSSHTKHPIHTHHPPTNRYLVTNKHVGDTVSLRILRGGQEQTLEVRVWSGAENTRRCATATARGCGCAAADCLSAHHPPTHPPTISSPATPPAGQAEPVPAPGAPPPEGSQALLLPGGGPRLHRLLRWARPGMGEAGGGLLVVVVGARIHRLHRRVGGNLGAGDWRRQWRCLACGRFGRVDAGAPLPDAQQPQLQHQTPCPTTHPPARQTPTSSSATAPWAVPRCG